MLRKLHFRGYRSLRDFSMKLGEVTVVTGENGVGKSNIYRALELMQRMAEGRFAASVADEGGLPSVLWAGALMKGEPRRMHWEIDHEHFQLEMDCGMIPSSPEDETLFRTDPDIKQEIIRLGGRVMARRKGPVIELRMPDGKMETSPVPLHITESMLSEVRDGIHYPAVTVARDTLLSWRFYHHFSTDARSLLRQPTIGSWSPVLDSDGANLAANLQTLIESKLTDPLDEAVEMAFPGSEWSPVDNSGRFHLQLLRPGLKRWLDAAELSDGTLRFFCLCAALLTPKPPPLMIINEPEASLHQDLLPPLAKLIARVSADTQILLVTHSKELANHISEGCDTKTVDLISHEGETRLRQPGSENSRRVWTFDDD